MKKFIIGLFVGLMVTAAFASFSTLSLSTQQALNILAKLGRKAYIATGGLNNTEISRITKFGYNKDVDSASPEVFASFGGGVYPSGSTTETLTIVSTSTSDDIAGTGARLLLISCIDDDGLGVSVVATMDGTSNVVTTQECKFVNRAVVSSSGSSNKNLGTISIVGTTSGLTYAAIPIGSSSTQQLMYYVPDNMFCYVDGLEVYGQKLGGGQLPRINFNVIVFSNFVDTQYIVRELFMDLDTDSKILEKDFKAEPLARNEIITIEVDTDTDNTIVSGSIEMTCRVL